MNFPDFINVLDFIKISSDDKLDSEEPQNIYSDYLKWKIKQMDKNKERGSEIRNSINEKDLFRFRKLQLKSKSLYLRSGHPQDRRDWEKYSSIVWYLEGEPRLPTCKEENINLLIIKNEI